MRNSHGHRDAMLTMAVTSLAVILLKVITAGMVIGTVQCGAMPDASVIGALLVPTLGAYVARRNRIASKGEEPKP